MCFEWKKDKYLKEGRLEEVLALLQVLALDAKSHRSESGLKTELSDKPRSSFCWVELAREHPEFFRVSDGKKNPVSLVTRHVSTNEDKTRPPLSPEHTQALLNSAIELHDREIKRRQRWAVLVPIWVAVIGGIVVLVKTFFGNTA